MFHNAGFGYEGVVAYGKVQGLHIETAVVLEEEVRRACPDAREPYEALAERADAPEIIRNVILTKARQLAPPLSRRPNRGALQYADCFCRSVMSRPVMLMMLLWFAGADWRNSM